MEPVFFEVNEEWQRWQNGHVAGRYRHARFMPKWASRLTLAVTNVRIQRLQDISEEDALAEGVEHLHDDDDVYENYAAGDALAFGGSGAARSSFRTLCGSINAKSGLAWVANPWVTAITFTVHRGNIDG